MKANRTTLLILVGTVVLAGCLGGGADGGPTGDDSSASSGDEGADSGTGGSDPSSDWCDAGQRAQFANPQTGEAASWEVQGIVEEDGREVCKAVWETNQGEVSRIEMYFTEDESYRKMVTYDADGEMIDEFEFGDG